MNSEPPTGQREGPKLEFKSREILKDSRAIAREVVGFLNAEGGSLWIGVPEVDGVAGHATPIVDVASAREILQDRLLDLIQPSPLQSEIELIEVPLETGGAVLRIDARRPEPGRTPFAFAHKGMLGFVRRVAHRVHPMTIQEVRDALRSPALVREEIESAEEWLARQRESCLEASAGCRTFLGLAVVGSSHADATTPSDAQREWWKGWVSRAGHAPTMRWSRLDYGLAIRDRTDHLEARFDTPYEAYQVRLRAYANGALLVELGTESLTFRADQVEQESERVQLHPYYLLGLISSVSKLAAEWLDQVVPRGENALIEFAIDRKAGLTLRAGSPNSHTWLFRPEGSLRSAQELPLVLSRPVRVCVNELVSRPGRVAVRVAERLYEAFGFELDELPREVDRRTGSISLPD